MQEKANTLENKPRLYAIEFLRIFFVFFIILGHIMERYPEINQHTLAFFHTKAMYTSFGVEFFFIIGGFFLYKRMLSAPNIFDLIKKIYTRLIPALLLVFLLCVVSDTTSITKFPSIFSLTIGLTIPGEATGWGDWYVGVYFWCSLLFIGLFYGNIGRGFLWTGILAYFTLCLKFNAPYDGWMKTYYTIIGNQLVRGIYSMGIGITAAYLTDKIKIPNKKSIRVIFTILEAYFLICVFNYIVRTSHSHFNFFEMEIIFAFLIFCIANSYGYISKYINSFSKIQLISRYTYPIFLGHIPFIKYLLSHQNCGFDDTACGLIVLGGALLMGIFEYHIIEKKFVPWIINYFKKEVA